MSSNPKTAVLVFNSDCSLRCQPCLRRPRPFGFLSFDDFTEFVYNSPGLECVGISGCSDAFLNPDLTHIVEWGYRDMGLGFFAPDANLALATREQIKSLVMNGLSQISISVCGASADTYENFRPGGNFSRLMENFEYLCSIRSKSPGNLGVNIVYHLNEFGCDLNEINRVKELADKLYVDLKFARDQNNFVPEDTNAVQDATGVDFSLKTVLDPYGHGFNPADCDHNTTVPFLNWDGGLLGCAGASNYEEFGGNGFKLGAAGCVNAKPYQDMRRAITTGKPPCGAQCFGCFQYRRLLWKGGKNGQA